MAEKRIRSAPAADGPGGVTPARCRSLPVQVDHVTVSGGAPVVVQSMTNTDTADVDALYLGGNSDRVDERWDGDKIDETVHCQMFLPRQPLGEHQALRMNAPQLCFLM